jgi:hypothetical protein
MNITDRRLTMLSTQSGIPYRPYGTQIDFPLYPGLAPGANPSSALPGWPTRDDNAEC